MASIALQGIKVATTHFAIAPYLLVQPYTPAQIQVLGATVDEWAILLCAYSGKIDNHYPKDSLLWFVMHYPVIFPKITSKKPLVRAKDIYTDGSRNGCGAYVVQEEDPVTFQFEPGAPQIVECRIVCQVFKAFSEPFNLISNSHYVVNAVKGLEIAADIKIKSPVSHFLSEVCNFIWWWTTPFYIGHIRAHTMLPGPMGANNDLADRVAGALALSALDNTEAAKDFHCLYHVPATTLRLKFHIPHQAARDIVTSYPSCVQFLHPPHTGVNARGLRPSDLRQMDVTHIPSFGICACLRRYLLWHYLCLSSLEKRLSTLSLIAWRPGRSGASPEH